MMRSIWASKAVFIFSLIGGTSGQLHRSNTYSTSARGYMDTGQLPRGLTKISPSHPMK